MRFSGNGERSCVSAKSTSALRRGSAGTRSSSIVSSRGLLSYVRTECYVALSRPGYDVLISWRSIDFYAEAGPKGPLSALLNTSCRLQPSLTPHIPSALTGQDPILAVAFFASIFSSSFHLRAHHSSYALQGVIVRRAISNRQRERAPCCRLASSRVCCPIWRPIS